MGNILPCCPKCKCCKFCKCFNCPGCCILEGETDSDEENEQLLNENDADDGSFDLIEEQQITLE